MGGMSWIHWALVLGVVALLFGGRGKLSGLMGDAAKGIKAFQDGLKGEDKVEEAEAPPAPLPSAKTSAKTTARKKDNIVT